MLNKMGLAGVHPIGNGKRGGRQVHDLCNVNPVIGHSTIKDEGRGETRSTK